MEKEIMGADQDIFEKNYLNVVAHIDNFEETLWFKRLSTKEKSNARQTIILFSEYMFDYHFQTMTEWDSSGVRDVVLNRFTYGMIASEEYFKQVIPILSQFLDYLYHQIDFVQGQYLAQIMNQLIPELIDEVRYQAEEPLVSNFLSLGEEMDLDMSLLSDINKLSLFVKEFEHTSARSQLYCKAE